MNTNELDMLAESIDSVADASTAAIAERTNRENAIDALFRLAKGDTVTKTSRETGIHSVTLRKLMARHEDVYKVVKSSMTRDMAVTAHKATQVLAKKFDDLDSNQELRDKTDIKSIAIAAGVAADKSLTLNGDATNITEHRHTVSREDYEASIREAQAQVIDIEPAAT